MMLGYLKVLVPLAALALLAFRYQPFRFPLAASAPSSTNPPAAQQVDAALETVRGGSLPGFESTTVGKAFEHRFQNPHWSSFQTPNGVTIVDFHGTTLANALNGADLNSSRLNPTIVRSNCIQSLGLGASMDQDATPAWVAQQTYRSNQAEIEERKLDNPAGSRSQSPSKEYLATVSARKQKEEAERKLDADREAKLRSCIDNFPIVVHFQFILSADQRKFELSYIDKEPFGDAAPNAVLTFVYR